MGCPLVSSDGLRLYAELSRAEGQAKATLVFVHGGGEHGGRYRNVVAHFTGRGFDCITFDYRGHGRAAGARGHCARYEEFLSDLEAALMLAREKAQRTIFLVAHSHGGLVTARYLVDASARVGDVTGFVFSSPFFRLRMLVPRWKIATARLLSGVVPRFALPSEIPAASVSRDPNIVEAYETDPLIHRVCTARWYTEIVRAQKECLAQAHQIKLPALVLQAGADRLVCPDATQLFFDRLGSADKKFTSYPELYHELLNEPERQTVLEDIERWLCAHTG
jgi:lysophospholipase